MTLLWKIILIFAALCVVVYVGLRWGLRRVENSNGLMRVVSRLGLGPGRSLLVVRIADRYLLLGVTEKQISLLKDLNTDIDPERLEELTKQQSTVVSSLLRQKDTAEKSDSEHG